MTETYQRKVLNIAKLTLVLGTLCFIVYKLFFAYNIQDLASGNNFTFTNSKIILLTATVLLIVPNIAIDSLKWKLVMIQHEKVSWLQSLQAVSAGIALGIITPNRIGDFAGKALFLKTYDKIKGAIASFIGSIAQTLAIVCCGSVGLWILTLQQQYINNVQFYCGLVAIGILLSLVYYLYINIHWLNRIISWRKITPYVDAFTHYSQKELTTLFILSLIRFGIFNIQYFLLLHFFDVPIAMQYAFPSLAAIFVVQAFVPSIILIEMGVRGATALFFLGLFSTNTSGILLAAYSLWILNIMFPALLGLYFILKLKARSAA
ncbi:hypothetical protein AEM51_04890 [Bacteroidetes bacterium UKL13-3]|jgi:hypothetical protein|nr:hypothetical protein AEM51_04890 [Bacteroidetes bacterium UKL13-3]HCP94909.1 hypothetical protein [Bacteroidota bacterium]